MDFIKGDIIFVHGKGIFSELIEEISQSEYSHTAVYINGNILIEAEGFRKTGYVNINKYKGVADVYRCDTLTPKEAVGIASYLSRQVGGQYDWVLLVWEFLSYRFRIRLPYKELHSHICSTLANDAYKSVGRNLCPNLKYPSPGDLAKSTLLRKVFSI